MPQAPQNSEARRLQRIASILLFVSGATALIYQVLWVRQLGLVAGVQLYATTIAVSGFFAGLALGAGVLGRLADRSPRPLRLYAALELGTGVGALGSTLVLARSAAWVVALHEFGGPLVWLPLLLLVTLPACMMGGTLPVLLRVRRPGLTGLGGAAAALYAANTAGAIAGVLAAPLLLIPWCGVQGAALGAALANLVLAALALWLDRAGQLARPVVSVRQRWSPKAKLCLGLYATAGGIALGYEILWTQAIVQFLSTRAYAFAVVIAMYLSGLALGSWLYGRVADRMERPWTAFGLLIAGAGASSLLMFTLLGPWLPEAQNAVGKLVLSGTDSRMLMMSSRFVLAAAVLLLVPTLFLGAAFPAAVRLVVEVARVGEGTGVVAAVNTAGGILGALVTGFWLLPQLGIVHSLGLLASAAAALGLSAVLASGGGPRPKVLAVFVLLGCVSALLGLPADKLARLLRDARGGRLLFYQEAATGTVSVLEQSAASGDFRRLYIQGVSNSGDAMPSLRYMRLQALVPLLIAPQAPRSALVIGLGTGITCGSLGVVPSLERRVCVELSNEVVQAARHFHGNLGVVDDARFEIEIADGRQALLASDAKYDLITLEPPPPAAAGVVNLYSREFYELGRRRLRPGGLLAQWWPLSTQNDADSCSLVQSFVDVFPHATLWTTELHEMLLVGSVEPLQLDVSVIQSRFETPGVARALTEVGVPSPAALLGTYVTGRAGLLSYANGAPPVTDDQPGIEYAAWVRPGELGRVLPRVLALSSEPPLTGHSQLGIAHQAVAAERRLLYRFYAGSLRALAGDREGWSSAMADVQRVARGNAYFAWFLGD